MPTGDGLLLRIKPPLGRLSSVQARLVADLAAGGGSGIIELTVRGNLQLRGLVPRSARATASALVDAGLAAADPAAERRRNVIVSPLAAHDPAVAPGTLALAVEVEAAMAGAAGLSPKFCVTIDGGGALPLAYSGDIAVDLADPARVRVVTNPAPGGLRPRAMAVQRRDVGSVLAQLLTEDGGERAPRARPAAPPGVGFHRYGENGRYGESGAGAFGLAPPFGGADAPTLRRLADLADRFSDGILCLGPQRVILFGSVRAADAPGLASRAAAAGLIVDPDDPRLRVHACIGNRGCASGSVDARGDAARFARVPFAGTLHVSGCPKRCAHPGAATLTRVGENGRYRAERAA
jgi:precorrin-3B synthase